MQCFGMAPGFIKYSAVAIIATWGFASHVTPTSCVIGIHGTSLNIFLSSELRRAIPLLQSCSENDMRYVYKASPTLFLFHDRLLHRRTLENQRHTDQEEGDGRGAAGAGRDPLITTIRSGPAYP